MISLVLIGTGYGGLVASFGWLGVGAVVIHVGVMLLCAHRRG